MKFPDVSELGAVSIEGTRYVVYLVSEDWDPDLDRHDSDHATGGCSCPCYPPSYVLDEAAREAVHRFRPCEACGGSPDIHNPNRAADFVGHEYR